jgi:RNA polymerase sigma-70 factor (ECF subfamily)
MYEKKAYNYALKLTHQADEASDLVSEAFIRAIKAIGRFKLDSQFQTWLYRIIRNCFLDQRKKRKIEIVGKVVLSDDPGGESIWLQVAASGKSPQELVEESDTARWLKKHLDPLPEIQRRVLLMYYWNELTYTEISKKLSVPAGTIKSRLSRTRLNLLPVLTVDPTFSEYV